MHLNYKVGMLPAFYGTSSILALFMPMLRIFLLFRRFILPFNLPPATAPLKSNVNLIRSRDRGRQEGFILSEVKPGGIYQSLGLRNGDVLLRINEYNINSPETALQAFTAIKGIDRAQLDILRNNTKMTMTYQIR
ncbi:MAG: hypothetical protein CVV37_06545 [Nitrospira bacterium HGW-Nitrospira-1]|nr:MAG: hypothetical protein CVV37_06545 [Nitrospira bacterium HGW-Nitrospira-1]